VVVLRVGVARPGGHPDLTSTAAVEGVPRSRPTPGWRGVAPRLGGPRRGPAAPDPSPHDEVGHDPRPDRGGGAGRDRDAAQKRSPGLADAALAEVRRQLRDRTGWGSPSGRAPMGPPWEGSELVGAERCLPSSKRGIAAVASRPSAGPSAGRATAVGAPPARWPRGGRPGEALARGAP